MNALPAPDYVVVAVGSTGDMLPMAAIARALQKRGHVVWFLAPEMFRALAAEFGLVFHSILDTPTFKAALEDPQLWHPHQGFKRMWPAMLQAHRATIRLLEPLAGQTPAPRLVAGTIALGAKVAHERWGWPYATVHIAPCWVFSALDPPRFRGLGWLRWLTPRWRAKVWAWTDRKLLDPVFAPDLNTWRASFGLPPVRRIVGRWTSSTQCVLGLYPPWFVAPQADWPAHLKLTGFALCDGGENWAMPESLNRFLGDRRDAIVFAAGSQMLHAERFFEVAAEACARIGRKALFLAPAAIAAKPWPAHVHVVAFAPLSQVLPRCAAIVSHPGIGTIAQAITAGVPHLLTPYAYDHFDNARRAVALGVARQLNKDVSAAALARELVATLGDAEVRDACGRWRGQPAPLQAVMDLCCDELERSLAAKSAPVQNQLHAAV